MEVIMNRATISARLWLADDKSTSTERQKNDCRDHAKSLGLDVVDGPASGSQTGTVVAGPFAG